MTLRPAKVQAGYFHPLRVGVTGQRVLTRWTVRDTVQLGAVRGARIARRDSRRIHQRRPGLLRQLLCPQYTKTSKK